MDGARFTLNGKLVEASREQLHRPAAEFIRAATTCKSIKVSCGEGGCGACAVELVEQDAHGGLSSVVAVNSCLLPVAALHGRHVLTSEGLGSSRTGLHPVQRRLAAFHATQCGFCTPGIAVACHAALAGGMLRSAGASPPPRAADVLASLDGNLCRCTGWRPIADAVKSLCADVDIEDLGLCSLQPKELGPASPRALVPATLSAALPHLTASDSTSCDERTRARYDAALLCLEPGVVLAPSSLEQLLSGMSAAARAGLRPRVLGGNTGAGVYHDQWAEGRRCVTLLTAGVPELQQLQELPPSDEDGAPELLMGAGVTLSVLLRTLLERADVVQGSGDACGARSLGSLAAHLSRVAGTLVRNAATLGGHLALARQAALESDLAPILLASDAQIQVTDVSGVPTWLHVEDFLRCGEPPVQAEVDSSTGLMQTGDVKGSAALLRQLSDGTALVTALRLPLPLSSNGQQRAAWSHKLTVHRHGNEHAAANVCIWMCGPADTGCSSWRLQIAVGMHQQCLQTGSDGRSKSDRERWRCSRAHHTEAVLASALRYSMGTGDDNGLDTPCSKGSHLAEALVQLPCLLLQDMVPTGRLAEYLMDAIPGVILQGLAVLLPPAALDAAGAALPKQGSNALSSSMLSELRGDCGAKATAAECSVQVQRGRQELPIDEHSAPPLRCPTQKDGGVLQATGEAMYAEDVPVACGALYAAYVTSSTAAARLVSVDWAAALCVPGVMDVVGPQDIPAGADVQVQHNFNNTNVGPPEPLFAFQTSEYVGQPLGLVLATSITAAREGAAAVTAQYAAYDSSNGGGIDPSSSLHNDWAQAPNGGSAKHNPNGVERRPSGPLASLDAAAAAGSWYNMGGLTASLSASKGDVDGALAAADRCLHGQLRIGSQRHFYMEPQTAVATPEEGGRMNVISSCQGCDQVLWAVAEVLQLRHNQVHVSSRRVGGGFGGKADRALFVAAAAAVAAHKTGRQVRLVVAPSVDGTMNAGRCPMELHWRAGVSTACGLPRLTALKLEVMCAAGAFMSTASVEVCSLRSAVDGAYDVPAFSFNARVARCHLPPRATVRGPGKVSAVLLLEQVMQSIAQALGVDSRLFREAHLLRLPPDVLTAATARAVAHGDTSLQPGKVAVLPHPRFLVEEQQQPPAAARQLTLLHTALGARLELEQLTLPYMWQELARIADYDTRRADADLFNKTHHLRKRGLAMVPARYLLYHRTAIARVDVYADGSILLSHPGTEMGQGIGVKVMQAAAYCLGSLLPPGEAAALLGYMRVSGGSSELMPHAGVAAGSTTSEAATAAITAACEQLLEQLRPIAESQQAASVTAAPAAGRCAAPVWEALVAAAAPVTPILTSRVVLSATGIGGLGTQEVGKVSTYNVFGVAAAEVCLDVLTGERSLLRADLMYDAGASVNPAIDLGQCEGAFMQGVGHVLHEEVLEDRASGQVLSARSWTYKPPALADMPQELNVHLLRGAPLHVAKLPQLSAKATGEPPFMLAAAVACALQDAIGAAWAEHGGVKAQPHDVCPLSLPATTAAIKSALPRIVFSERPTA